MWQIHQGDLNDERSQGVMTITEMEDVRSLLLYEVAATYNTDDVLTGIGGSSHIQHR